MNYITCLKADKTIHKLLCALLYNRDEPYISPRIYVREGRDSTYFINLSEETKTIERENGVVVYWCGTAFDRFSVTFRVLRPTLFEGIIRRHSHIALHTRTIRNHLGMLLGERGVEC